MKIYILIPILMVNNLPAMLLAEQFMGRTTEFLSPGGIAEQCIALPSVPGATARPKDRKYEQKYCDINFYDSNTALCPKIWSTSPGTIIYDLSPGSYAGRVKKFEETICRKGKNAKKHSIKKLAKFKSTMNASETSGTFSTSSLLYYQFSRYFDTLVDVPVSVWRSIDRKNHLLRVSKSGVQLSSKSRMLHAGWLKMESAETNPATYHPDHELFTDDARAIYGVLLKSPGHRYNTSVNGTRVSGWGVGQNNDFQETAPYLALRSEEPLLEAVEHGLYSARNNIKMNHDLGKNVSDAQMVFWMTELTEITLLDFIFSQQDRVGNIDYLDFWYWLENGQVHKKRAYDKKTPSHLSMKNPMFIKRSQLNDNDAGGRIGYINFSKKTKMLEKQRHYRAATYKQLVKLNRDFGTNGELYQYLSNTFALSKKQINHVIKNTAEATSILQETCRQGKLRFDLDPDDFLRTGIVVEQIINCENP